MQVSLKDLLTLLEVYNTIPAWLPLPEGAGATPMNDIHQEYLESYAIGVQVALSKTQIQKTLSHYQNELGALEYNKYGVWNRPTNLVNVIVPTEELDCYSLLILQRLQRLHRYHLKT